MVLQLFLKFESLDKNEKKMILFTLFPPLKDNKIPLCESFFSLQKIYMGEGGEGEGGREKGGRRKRGEREGGREKRGKERGKEEKEGERRKKE